MPTLVLHSVGDRVNAIECARHLASSIAGARLVALDSENHIVLEHEPAWPVLVSELRQFLDTVRAGAGLPASTEAPVQAVDELLSARELQVLNLAAAGQDNDAIAAALTLSVRTVERHLQNIYVKLDVRGKSARTAAVARLLNDRHRVTG